MKKNAESLEQLLQRKITHNKFAAACIQALGKTSLKQGVTLPLERAQDVYYTRAEVNKNTGGSVEGYEDLVHNLKSTNAESITLHLIKDEKLTYIIFTSSDVQELIGILLSPRIKASFHE